MQSILGCIMCLVWIIAIKLISTLGYFKDV